MLPGANNKGHLESGRGQKGREEGHAAHEEVVQMLVAGAEQFSASGMPVSMSYVCSLCNSKLLYIFSICLRLGGRWQVGMDGE